MTAYPTDFPGAPDVLTPVESTLVMGVDPLLTLLLGVLVLAAVAAAWLAGRTLGQGRKPADAVDAIHREILNAAVLAMSARDSELPGRARDLRSVITARLGPLLQVAKGAGGPVKALDQALAGKKEVEVPPPAKPDGGHGTPPLPHPGHAPSAAAAAATGSPVIVNVLGGVAEARPAEPPRTHEAPVAPPSPPPPPPAKAEKKTVDMTLDEQVQALTLAVRQFHGWWADAGPRKTELREVIKALTTPPPRSFAHDHGGHGHGSPSRH
jgi:hypothetical protein